MANSEYRLFFAYLFLRLTKCNYEKLVPLSIEDKEPLVLHFPSDTMWLDRYPKPKQKTQQQVLWIIIKNNRSCYNTK